MAKRRPGGYKEGRDRRTATMSQQTPSYRVISIAVQFSSTILLSDLKEGSLVGFPSYSQRNLTMPKDQDDSLGGWTRPPHDFSLFGELYSEYTAEPDSNGVSDTESKRHAMLPYTEAANRTATRNYKGPALVYSSRVACMPPTIVAEISTELEEATGNIHGYMIGRGQISSTLSRADLATSIPCYGGQCLAEIPFNYALPTLGKKQSLASSYCTPQETDVSVWTSSWKVGMRDWITTASVFLVFSSNMHSEQWELSNSSSLTLPLLAIEEE
ncbi:hypothetical protein F5B22DRAFT_645063 [Xylaria bambusicola]|uniref:uncharacterized protein n=1 Tax=Xylaria bambusicola TaxID=326684 RepID=UPI0020074F18|nr:uncharacterized protein F5B22DRAFT_645063 [Xylaria bambusicola]KAI0518298.1 hypothetical protein F5B22DRAFT_645063 [Xylaria bambusicola]